jgi:hypothetical protein
LSNQEREIYKEGVLSACSQAATWLTYGKRTKKAEEKKKGKRERDMSHC